MGREKAQEERRLRGICGESTVCVLVHYQALELGSLISKLKVTDQDTIFSFTLSVSWVSLVAQTVKSPPATQETWVRSLGWEDPLGEGMATTPVLLPGESYGQRSLVGYSPRGRKR